MSYANEDILNSITPSTGVIPESTTSFFENALYVIEASENWFSEYLQECEIGDLALYESGGIALLESEEESRLTKIKNGFIDWVKKIWAAIQSAFKKALDWFGMKISGFKKKLIGVSAPSVGALDYLDEKQFSKKFSGQYTFLTGNGSGDLMGKVASEASSLQGKFNGGGFEKDTVTVKYLTGIDADSLNDLRSKLKDRFIVTKSVTKADLKRDWSDIYKLATDTSTTKKRLSKGYTIFKKVIDDCISSAKKLKKDKIDYAKDLLSCLKTSVNILNAIDATYVDCHKKAVFSAMRIMFTASKIKAPKNDEKSTNENAIYNDIMEAFNW